MPVVLVKDVRRIVSEGSRCSAGLPCGLSPCPLNFYCRITGEYQTVFEEFPAYGSVLLRLALVNLRTVIVTAAVYRGFGSEPRLAANSSP